ncbi:type II secretory pathway pseudopilin PulG [Streptomyces sp. B4I13]|uniref:divisome protein SepX/GlpR n=1 Tax=Streptomyces sp. B4I13 TaxID=3042271 RepID=UPI00277DF527|nr:gephyrin-like molybdotransferase receptor GlpR [Streptomyces sp. B4I13]MDQ0961228.1 type II secretory pathway pseudopilin PulG [Streptomyces sp. B4I13]
MSSSGLIYAVIVGAWAAYLVPMWLRRQDELNEARPTERFSTAIRLLSGRAGMERRYAKDLKARSTEEGEPVADASDAVTDSVDVRAFAMPPTRPQVTAQAHERGQDRGADRSVDRGADRGQERAPGRSESAREQAREQARDQTRDQAREHVREHVREQVREPAGRLARDQREQNARRAASAQAAAARAQRSKSLARRRRTTVMLFFAFTIGAIVAAVGGLAFLWAPAVPAVLLSAYIGYLRAQERRRFAFQMDRRRAEVAAQRLRERQPRRRAPAPANAASADPGPDAGAEEPHADPEPQTDPGLLALAADRRALVEQTDHAEWIDQQRERQRRPGHGDSWDPVPVPLPTYVTAPVAPRATSDVDLGAADAWSSARSSSVAPEHDTADAGDEAATGPDDPGRARDDAAEEDRGAEDGGRSDARRAASARRSRERGRTPLFDQYEDGERRRAANE